MIKSFITIFLSVLINFSYHSNVLSANNVKQGKKWENYALKSIYHSKNLFAKKIDEILPEPQASLLNGMLFGIKASIPKDFFTSLKRTGVLHVIALSGTNISILINAVFGLLSPLFGRRSACFLAILLIIIFIFFVGPSPSVVRAGIMGGLSLLAGYFGRQYWGFFGLLMAVGIMILISPKVAGDLGFQLSVAATAGIMVFASQKQYQKSNISPSIPCSLSRIKKQKHIAKVKKILIEIRKGMENNLKVTLAAQIFTLPILLTNFGELSIVSPLANILVAPAVTIITPWGMLAAILVTFIRPIGVVLLWSLWILLSYFVTVVKLTSLVPFASISVPKIGWGVGGLYYLIVLFLYFRKKIKIII